MLRTTFYSYKGGVGRTLACLHVGAELARRSCRVLIIDLDLEAPGIGLSSWTRAPNGRIHESQRGVSDLLLEWRDGLEPDIREMAYEIEPNLSCIQCGTRAQELGQQLDEIFGTEGSEDSYLFELLVETIESEFRPDFLLFDSRTGRSDIAGVCLLHLAQVAVLVSGLNSQNVEGLASTFSDLLHHGARPPRWIPLLLMSPLPRANDLEVKPLGTPTDVVAQALQGDAREPANVLFRAAYTAHRILHEIHAEFDSARRYYPSLRKEDAVHHIEYDPRIPVLAEHEAGSIPTLARSYSAIADTLERAAGRRGV